MALVVEVVVDRGMGSGKLLQGLDVPETAPSPLLAFETAGASSRPCG